MSTNGIDLSAFGDFGFGESIFGGLVGIEARHIYYRTGDYDYLKVDGTGLFAYERPHTGEYAYELEEVSVVFTYETDRAKGEFIISREE